MKIQIEWVNPKQLKPAGFNPPMRVNLKDKKMKTLIEGIKRVGFVVPVITANNYEIIDGHRRTTAALYLKLGEIPIIRLPLSLQDGWATLNASTKPIDSKAWVYVLSPAGGFDVNNAPEAIREVYFKIEEYLPGGVAMLQEHGMALNVIKEFATARNFLGVDPDDKKKCAQILRWLIVHRMQNPVRVAVKANLITPRDLWRAIQADVALVQSYAPKI